MNPSAPSASDTLSGLRPIHIPAPPSWWPPAPGWWILAAVVAGFLLWFLWRYSSRRLVREALQELSYLESASELSSREFASKLSILLKRYAMAAFPNEDIAGLTGERWLEFLQDHAPSNMDFRLGPAEVFGAGIYSDRCNIEREKLLQMVKRWIRENRPHSLRFGRIWGQGA